jgi:hypothetical protein
MPEERLWEFRQLLRSEMRADPVQREFFAPQAIADKLVRESVQNSLDANRQPTLRMRFVLSGMRYALPPDVAGLYTNDLVPHLAAVDIPFDTSGPLQYLLVEDFGTTGLRGDAAAYASTGSRNDFYYFFRNVGRSEKTGGERGRWGVGKWVFPAASRISAFLGLTIRENEGLPLLMGQCVLRIHSIDGNEYAPYGFFARFAGEERFQMPFEGGDVVGQFNEHFRLSRGADPGFSVAVLDPDPELGPASLKRAVIRNYFYPLITGELSVDVIHEDSTTTINRDSISDVVQNLEWEDRQAIEQDIAFTKRAIESEPRRVVKDQGTSAPSWSEALFEPSDLADLRAVYEEGGLISLRVPVTVRTPTSTEEDAYFLYLQRDETLDKKGRDHYIREGITISEIQMLSRGVRGIVYVPEGALAQLLGDAENPSHTLWREREEAIKSTYIQGASRVRFVKNSLDSLSRLLARPAQGRDQDLLGDVFYVDETEERRRDKIVPPVIVPPPQPPAFSVHRIDGGFKVGRNNAVPLRSTRLRIQAAYNVRRGNPFARYSEHDFAFDGVTVTYTATNAVVDYAGENRVDLDVLGNGDTFEFEALGFDSHRDVVVRVRAIEEGAEDAP